MDLENITRVIKLGNSREVNRFLDYGWVLLHVGTESTDGKLFTACYSLGWDKTNGEMKQPPDSQSYTST